MKRIAKSGAFTAILLTTSVATAGTSAQLPLQDGDIVATSYPGFLPCCFGADPDPAGFSLTLVDARIPPVSGPSPTPGTIWNAPMFNNASGPPSEIWNAENLGLLFGLCFDTAPDPNIYAAATSNAYGDYTAYTYPLGGVGPDGTAAIYMIDGVTADINSWVVTTPTFTGGPGTNRIPTSGPGLGQVCHNPVHDEFFATNFEDGQIYRIDANGIIIDTYDPFAPTTPIPGVYVDRGERPWAVEVHNGRLYFSVWLRDASNQAVPWNPAAGATPPDPNNSIWSVQIDSSGALSGAPILEIVIPYLNLTNARYSNPVSDIAFSENGDMLCGERVMVGDFGQIDAGHVARCLEYELVSGVWQPSLTEYFIGSPVNPATGEPNNCAGGVDYDCDQNAWSGGDVIGPAGYGIQGVPAGGNTPGSPISTSYIIPFPHQLKAGMADVDYYRECDTGCDIVCDADDFFENEICPDDINHGCDLDPPLCTNIRCGYNVCGDLWAENGDRDTDWYCFQVGDANGDGFVEIHAVITTEIPVAIRIHDGCTELAVTYVDACSTGEVVACVPVPPGMYFFSVKPETSTGPILNGYPCSSRYRLETICYDECEGDPAGPCVTPPPDMIAWWPFDETGGSVANEVLFDNDAYHANFPTPMPGKVDFALDFDGISQYARVADDPIINFGAAAPGSTNGDFSIDAWIFIDDFAFDHSPIVEKRGNERGYYFAIVDGELALQLEDGAGAVFHGGGGAVPTGEWVHVAVTVDRDDPLGIRFYVNGVTSGTSDPTSTPGDLTSPVALHIGNNFYNLIPGDGQAYFDGRIDEVEIFDRVLIDAEVFDLYTADSSGKCKHCCTVPSAVGFCNGADSVVVKIQVCNKSTAEQTYNVSIAGLTAVECGTVDGPTGFTFIDPPVVTVVPGDCTAVRVKIDRPAGMVNNGDVACYEACVENLANGQIVCCRGKLIDRRKWCAVAIPNDDLIKFKISLPQLLAFDIINIDRPIGVISYGVYPQFPQDGDDDNGTTPPDVISLDGLPPGKPVVGELQLQPGDTAPVDVEVTYTGPAPLHVHEIALKADFDGDGLHEATLAVIPIRVLNDPPCTGDTTGDGVVNVTDALGMLAAWGTDDPLYDIAPKGGDGNVDIQDLLSLLSQWGECP